MAADRSIRQSAELARTAHRMEVREARRRVRANRDFFYGIVGSLAIATFLGVWMWMEPQPTATASAADAKSIYYAGCNEVRAAGVAPLYRGQPGYRSDMDGDGDGIACEPHHD